jgi:hypothetical protein
MRKANASGMFPYTPATNLLYGLDEALTMLEEEGLAQVFARHDRHAEATRCAVRAWDLEILCRVPEHYSSSLTAVCMPEGHDADAYRKVVLENYDMSLGSGLGEVAGKIFRIGHLGDFNDLTLLGAARYAVRCRDGAAQGRRAVSARRRPGGHGLPGRKGGLTRGGRKQGEMPCVALTTRGTVWMMKAAYNRRVTSRWRR